MKKYHIIAADLPYLEAVQPTIDILAIQGFRVISTVAAGTVIVWTLERDVRDGEQR